MHRFYTIIDENTIEAEDLEKGKYFYGRIDLVDLIERYHVHVDNHKITMMYWIWIGFLFGGAAGFIITGSLSFVKWVIE